MPLYSNINVFCHEYLNHLGTTNLRIMLVTSCYIFARLCGRSGVELDKCPGSMWFLISSSTQATSKDTWFFFPKFVPKILVRSTTSDLLFSSSLGLAHTYPALYSVHFKSSLISLLSFKVVQLVLMLDFFYCYLMRCALPLRIFWRACYLNFIFTNLHNFQLFLFLLSHTCWNTEIREKTCSCPYICRKRSDRQFERILDQRIVWSDYYINARQLFSSVYQNMLLKLKGGRNSR